MSFLMNKMLRVATGSAWGLVQGLTNVGEAAFCAEFNHDSTLLATGSSRTLNVIDTSDRSLVVDSLDIAVGIIDISFSPDGTMMALAGSSYPYLLVYDTSDWSKITTPAISGTSAAYAVDFSPNGDYLAFGHAVAYQNALFILDTSDWSILSNTATATEVCRDVCFNPAGTLLAFSAGFGPYYLKVIDTTDWSELAGIPNFSDFVTAVQFSPDGSKLVVTNSVSPYISVLETTGWTNIASISLIEEAIRDVDFSTDGSYLAVAHEETPYFSVIDTSDWSLVADTIELGYFGTSVDFSPNGLYLAVSEVVSPYVHVIKSEKRTV